MRVIRGVAVFVVLALVALALAGCGGEDEAAAPTASAAPAPSPEPSACAPARPALVSAIATGLEDGLSLRNGQVVRSGDYERVYMVAAVIEGPGFDGGEAAVWATNRANDPGLIYSVDALAAEFSDWGDAGGRFSGADDGVERAESCATS